MKRSEIRNAYDMMTPTRSQKDKMLAAILSETPVTDSRPGRYVQKQTHPSRFGTVAAAALLVCVLSGGMFVLGRMGRSDVIQQNSGAADWLWDTALYQASDEWAAYLTEQGKDTQGDIALDYASRIYGCEDSGDEQQLRLIREDHNLKMPNHKEFVTDQLSVILENVGVENILTKIDGVQQEIEGGCFTKEEGYFTVNGETTLSYAESPWRDPIKYQLKNIPKDYFYPDLIQYCPIDDFECWTYTTVAGEELLLASSKGAWLIFADKEISVFMVEVKRYFIENYDQFDGKSMTREALEAFAETFDYSLSTGKVWFPEEYTYILNKYQTGMEQAWNIDQYHNNDLSYLPVYLQDPEDLGYCLMDLDGNGYEELLVGTDNVIFDLFTYNDEVGILHLLCAGEKDPYVMCENNIIKHTGYTDMKATDYTFFRLSDGIDLLEEQVVIRTDDGWEAGPRKIKTEAVSEEKAMEIVDSYVEISLDYLTFIDTDSKVEEPDTTEPTFTDGSYVEILEKYAFAFTEDWDMETCQKKGISYLTASLEDIQDIGYTYIDLDGNGYEELIVSDGELIYDLYTRQNDGVISLLSSGEHTRYYLCENNVIAYHNSGRRPSSIYSYSVVDGGELDCIELVSYNAEVDAENPWFHQAGGCGMMDPITEAEANEIMDGYKKITIETRDIMRGTE